MTIDDDLLKAIDRVSKQLHTSRSAFTRKALHEALFRYDLEHSKADVMPRDCAVNCDHLQTVSKEKIGS